MKNYPYILSLLALLVSVNVGVANTTQKETQPNDQGQEQEDRRKSDQGMMRPDSESEAIPMEQELSRETEEEPVEDDKADSIQVEKVDSVREEGSVSKYNFIFYFLYKFKYDGEEAP